MHQPSYCSVVFRVLGDFGDARQAVGWRKMKISTDRNTSTSEETAQPSEQARQYLVRSNLCFAKNNNKVQMVEHNDPSNKRGYTFLGFCKDNIWTAKKCKAVYEHLDDEGYN